jgi:hypothetical protein
MKRIYCTTLILSLLAVLLAGSSPATLTAAQVPLAQPNTQYPISNITTFTVSGTIRDPDDLPVPDVEVGVSSEYEWDEETTDGNGFYSVEVTGPTWLRFYIEPLVEARLARMVVYEDGPFNSNTTLDFDLVAGHLFAGEVQGPTGDSVYLPWGADIIALTNPPPENVSYSFWTHWRDGTFEIVYPPDVYNFIC